MRIGISTNVIVALWKYDVDRLMRTPLLGTQQTAGDMGTDKN